MKLPIVIDPVPVEQKIHVIRGEKVILDFDLALLYGISTKALIQSIRRNPDRFPPDFLFQLNRKEFISMMSQSGISVKMKGRGGRRTLPYAFTEHGAIMAATVLNSPRAIRASVYIVRAFVKLRKMIATHRDLAQKIDELERSVTTHDSAICSLFDTIRKLMAYPDKPHPKIGFDPNAMNPSAAGRAKPIDISLLLRAVPCAHILEKEVF